MISSAITEMSNLNYIQIILQQVVKILTFLKKKINKD